MSSNRWNKEIEKGNVWRAKEILKGHISQMYVQEEFYAYGKILYEGHDLYEAGRYLFAAGAIDDEKYIDAINLFLNRNKDQYLISKLPKRFQKLTFEEMPESVQEFFISQCGEEIKERHNAHITKESADLNEEGWKEKLYILYGIVFMILFLIVLAVGTITSINWLGNLMRSDQEKCIQECGRWDDDSQRCLYPKPEILKSLNPSIRKVGI